MPTRKRNHEARNVERIGRKVAVHVDAGDYVNAGLVGEHEVEKGLGLRV
jgi:hypothetical protein